jgi:hypothetical protein
MDCKSLPCGVVNKGSAAAEFHIACESRAVSEHLGGDFADNAARRDLNFRDVPNAAATSWHIPRTLPKGIPEEQG